MLYQAPDQRALPHTRRAVHQHHVRGRLVRQLLHHRHVNPPLLPLRRPSLLYLRLPLGGENEGARVPLGSRSGILIELGILLAFFPDFFFRCALARTSRSMNTMLCWLLLSVWSVSCTKPEFHACVFPAIAF